MVTLWKARAVVIHIEQPSGLLLHGDQRPWTSDASRCLGRVQRPECQPGADVGDSLVTSCGSVSLS
jgi:hypothetical protein